MKEISFSGLEDNEPWIVGPRFLQMQFHAKTAKSDRKEREELTYN
jgi:hypothetical protein